MFPFLLMQLFLKLELSEQERDLFTFKAAGVTGGRGAGHLAQVTQQVSSRDDTGPQVSCLHTKNFVCGKLVAELCLDLAWAGSPCPVWLGCVPGHRESDSSWRPLGACEPL